MIGISAMAIILVGVASPVAPQEASYAPPPRPADGPVDLQEPPPATTIAVSPPPTQARYVLTPFGRLQYDLGHVGNPGGVAGLGFGREVRRARLGLEGKAPGGLGFKIEADFAGGEFELTDAYLTYKPSKSLRFVAGQHNNFQSLEELTSSRFISFLERAAFTDAFNFERRVGLSGTWSKRDILASAGVFTGNIETIGSFAEAAGLEGSPAASVDARLVYAPKSGGRQLHFGGTAHRRDAGGGDMSVRYRQRAFVHVKEARFLATPALTVEAQSNYGLEAAAIDGPLHLAGEVHWLRPDRTGAAATPTFFGGYAEIGYHLTGETRGYKAGRWDRTAVLRPLGKAGGLGALQVNLRYDHLDLSSAGIVGGRQGGYQASLLWIPRDNIRFLLNYARLRYRDATIPTASGDRDYGVNVVGARAQVDF